MNTMVHTRNQVVKMNRRDTWFLFIILILIFIGYFYPIIYDLQEHEGVTIFVIDTFDDSLLSHGDIVSMIIEQETPQFEIRRLNVKEEDTYGIDKYYQALDTVYNYKLQNYDRKVIVNISLGFYQPENYHRQLIENLNDLGVGIVAAAGNDDSPISFYPSAYKDEVVAVASVKGDEKTDYSNYGEHIDVCAEGRFFTTFTLPQFFSYRASGTSFAAPRVSSFLAKIMATQKDIDFNQALEKLKELSVPLDDELFERNLLGSGKISNFKFLINYNQTKLFFYYILPGLVFLMMFYLLVKKMGLIAVPYLLLLVIVLGPFFIFIRDNFLRVFTKRMFTSYNFKLLGLFIISYLLAKLITTYEKYYLLKLYVFVNVVTSTTLYFWDGLNLLNFGIYNIILILVLFSIERYYYNKTQDSKEITELNSDSYRVVNKVKENIMADTDFDKDKLYELLKLYKFTRKKHVKKAVVDILIKKLETMPLSYLFKNARNIIVKNYLFEVIENKQEKVKLEDLFKVLKYEYRFIDKLFNQFTYHEIKDQLMIEFDKKEVDLDKLLKVVNYYNERSFMDYLILIYEDYEECWDRFLIAKTILKLSVERNRKELVRRFLQDRCGLVIEEAEYYRKKEGYDIG